MKRLTVDETSCSAPDVNTLDVLAQRIADWIDAEIIKMLP